MTEEKKEVKNKSVVVTFRIFQAICFGVFALGLSLIAGDYSGHVKSWMSTTGITTTIFGLIGAIITGILAKQSERW